jgi:lysyl-tRNA synthetase class 2
LSDFLPTATWPNLRLRAALLRRLREFFDARGFLEVETPVLSADVVVDRHLDPFSTVLADDPCRPDVGRRLWLQTSPEFGMKRLLAAGGEAIYQVSRVFRNSERGRLHNPEFTLVEWYRRGDDMAAGMRLLSDVCDALLQRGPAEQVSYREAFRRFAGVDPLTDSPLQEAARQRGLSLASAHSAADRAKDRDMWLDLLLVELVQPKLGIAHPTILYDFPASQAALARVRREQVETKDVDIAERFELFVSGVELANGYHELLDAAELRRRASEANAQRAANGKPALPEESRLLAAMGRGLPACSGTALGFDRLVMVAAGASHIDEVIAFPIERA